MVRHAYDTVPFYRSVIRQAKLRPEEFQTTEDLAKLDLITGEEIAKAPELFISRRYSQVGVGTLLKVLTFVASA